jgi:hypothetical protein
LKPLPENLEPLPENLEPLPHDEGAEQRTAIALYLQDTKRQTMEHLIHYTISKSIKIEALIHDEIFIDSKSTLDLEEAHIYIELKTGYDVKFESQITSPTKEDLEWLDKHEPFIRKEDFFCFDKVRNAVMMLNKERAVDFLTWRNVIFSIGGELNYSPEGRKIAHEFSKQSEKNNKASADKLYSCQKKNGASLKMGSIMMWLTRGWKKRNQTKN